MEFRSVCRGCELRRRSGAIHPPPPNKKRLPADSIYIHLRTYTDESGACRSHSDIYISMPVYPTRALVVLSSRARERTHVLKEEEKKGEKIRERPPTAGTAASAAAAAAVPVPFLTWHCCSGNHTRPMSMDHTLWCAPPNDEMGTTQTVSEKSAPLLPPPHMDPASVSSSSVSSHHPCTE